MSVRYGAALLLALAACSDTSNPDGEHNEGELITTVELVFTPDEGDVLVFRWADPELDGDPEIDTVQLAVGQGYGLAVRFLDEANEPSFNVTDEVADEAEQHQVFFTGAGVDGPATGPGISFNLLHAYADTDSGGLPIGLDNTAQGLDGGQGVLTVTLRHLPPEGGTVTKVAGLAEQVANGGFGSIGGETDVQVSYDLAVQ